MIVVLPLLPLLWPEPLTRKFTLEKFKSFLGNDAKISVEYVKEIPLLSFSFFTDQDTKNKIMNSRYKNYYSDKNDKNKLVPFI